MRRARNRVAAAPARAVTAALSVALVWLLLPVLGARFPLDLRLRRILQSVQTSRYDRATNTFSP